MSSVYHIPMKERGPYGPGTTPDVVAPKTAGGNNGGMDRLDHLEKRVDEIDGRLGRIEKDVDTLKGDVSTLKSDVSSIKTTLASIDAKLDIGSIRASVEKAHTDIYKWIVSIIAVVGAIYFGIQRLAPTVPQQGYPPAIAPQAPQPAPAPAPTQPPQAK
ncbi:hypothetical protein ACOTHJ_21335 [Achromobacter xylosoxidans]